MTQEERTQLQDAMLRDHFGKMQAISDRGVATAEKWGGVAARMCDYHSNTQAKVSEILGDDLKDLLVLNPAQPKGSP